MPSYENITVDRDDKIVVVTINRPKTFNALNIATIYELIDAFLSFGRDKENLGAVVLTGAGEKSFAAGADIQEIHNLDLQSGKELSARGNRLLSLIEKLPIPVIAAVNGFALGGGCEVAMACHLRVASENAKFGQPEVNLGIIPGYGGTQRLPRLIGRGRALELMLTGKMISAADALGLGLVNAVVPQVELMNTALKLAKEIADKPRLAVSAILESVEAGLQLGLDRGLQVEENLFAFCCATQDKQEGTAAFLEKRQPTFIGR